MTKGYQKLLHLLLACSMALAVCLTVATTAYADTPLTKVSVPKAVKGLVYNESEQIGVPEGTGYTITGNTATDAGTYTAVLTLEEGYQWSDGKKTPRKIKWTIAKATQAIGIHTYPMTIYKGDIKDDSYVLYDAFWLDGDWDSNTGMLKKVGGTSLIRVVDGRFAVMKKHNCGKKVEKHVVKIKFTSPASKNYKAWSKTVSVTIIMSNEIVDVPT